jgi:hypothetical protein
MTHTQKLIETLKKNSEITKGTESISLDGNIKYRYDSIVLKYENAANWLVNLFEKAAIENGKKRTATQFFIGNSSIAYQRPKFNGEPNGKIIMSEFIQL